MKSFEATGRTVEEAINAGLAESGLSIGDVNVQILDEGSKGLFGLFGSRMARVRLVPREEEQASDTREMFRDSLREKPPVRPAEAPRPPRPEQPAEAPKPSMPPRPARPDRPAEAPRPPRPEREAGAATTPAAPAPEQGIGRPPRPRGPRERMGEQAARPAAPAEQQARPPRPAAPQEQQARPPRPAGGPREESREGQGRDGQGRRRNPRGAQQPQAGQPRPPRPPRPRAQAADAGQGEGGDDPVVMPASLAPRNLVDVPDPQPESPEGIAREFLLEMTRLMGMDVQVAMSRDEEGHVYARMDGDPQGILIGRRGETLDAMQYLTSLRVNRGREEYVRVTLDSEGYRRKREEALVRLATRMANRARKTGRRVSMEPMNPYERRIFHSALQAIPGIATHSEGEEPNRHVVITPVEVKPEAAETPAEAGNPD
ncbi:MAG TPA: RNA-binding cell elongation regulator Jag/EloR [Candidatus Limnocylindria bacterium]|nr:RNA-binding cell elongation regulator Jag/EloR [Candidatus Limnocylindria bacterium]